MKKLRLLALIAPLSFFIFGSARGQVITTIAGNGSGGYSGDGGPATAAEIYQPITVDVDRLGNIYMSDFLNCVVRKISPAGVITTFAGTGSAGYSGDGGPATAAGLNRPDGIATDGAGNVYITDLGNNCIRKVDASGTITTIVGNGTLGYSGDGGPATAAELYSPSDVILDGSGNIYISDCYNNVIRKVNPSGIITTFAGNDTAGYSGDGGPASAAELSFPGGLDIDSIGNIFIADFGNNRIRKINTSGVITTVAGNGTAGFSGDGGPAIDAELSGPIDVAVDKAGNLFFADFNNSVIRKVNLSGIITTFAGNDTAGYSGDGGFATAAELYNADDLAVDAAGNLYIADYNNHRIRKVSNCRPYAAPIYGPFSVCAGATIALTDSTGGGRWSTSSAAIATIDGTGLVSAFTAGQDTITYSLTNACGTTTVTQPITVDTPLSAGIISGIDSLCPGDTVSFSCTSSTGVWSSSNSSLARVDIAGLVTGLSSGRDTISYIVTNACGTNFAHFPLFIRTVAECLTRTSNLPNTTSDNLLIAPNPNKGSFTITFSSPFNESASVSIFSITGQIIKELTIPTTQPVLINLTQPDGIYFISARTPHNTSQSTFIVNAR